MDVALGTRMPACQHAKDVRLAAKTTSMAIRSGTPIRLSAPRKQQ